MKLEPVGFVNTRNPNDSSIIETMRVVVVLPLVPETSTTPSGSCASVRRRKPGSTRSTTLPGNALPPWCVMREAQRTPLPSVGVAKAYQGVTNPTGSNFTRGVVSALLQEVSAGGALDADIAVLELDEAYAVHFVEGVPRRARRRCAGGCLRHVRPPVACSGPCR